MKHFTEVIRSVVLVCYAMLIAAWIVSYFQPVMFSPDQGKHIVVIEEGIIGIEVKPVDVFLDLVRVPCWLVVLIAGCPIVLLLWYTRKRIPPGHCQKCGYNLTGNVSGVCPECGERTQGAQKPTP